MVLTDDKVVGPIKEEDLDEVEKGKGHLSPVDLDEVANA